MNELDKEDTGYFLPHRNHILPTSFERSYIILFKLSTSPKSVNKRLHNHHFKKSLLHTGTPKHRFPTFQIYLRKDELRPTPFRQPQNIPPYKVDCFRKNLFQSILGVQGKEFGQKTKVLKIVKKSSLNTWFRVTLFFKHHDCHSYKSSYINTKVCASTAAS